MDKIENTYISFTNSDKEKVAKSLYQFRQEILGRHKVTEAAPTRANRDDRPVKLEKLLGSISNEDFSVSWSPREYKASGEALKKLCGHISRRRPSMAKISFTRIVVELELLQDFIFNTSFDLLCMGPKFRSWRDHPKYTNLGFGNAHYGHGFLAAFSGEEGHKRMVSPHWLEYGPWRLVKKEDKTIVQFHDELADVETAIEQAAPGHLKMGISAVGGFIQMRFPFKNLKPNFFDPNTQTSIVLISEEKLIPSWELLEAAAAKYWQPFEGIDIKQIAYVFIDEKTAYANLKNIWMYGLECRLSAGSGERNLTDQFEAPEKLAPNWVKKVQDRHGY